MNHFAHLVLAQPTIESTVGNLLGDFARGVEEQSLPDAVRAGLAIREGLAGLPLGELDAGLDPLAGPEPLEARGFLLLRYWERFDARDPDALIGRFYARMLEGQALMPAEPMRRTTRRMVEYDWFGSYRDDAAVAEAIDRVAGRIRFAHAFDNAIEDLQRNHDLIRDGFFEFFPALRRHVEALALERPEPSKQT